MSLTRKRPLMRPAPVLVALAAVLVASPAGAQALRSSLDQVAQLAPPGATPSYGYDPAAVPGRQPGIDSVSGGTSRRAAPRASKPVRRDTGAAATRTPVKAPTRDVVGLPPPPPEPILRRGRAPEEADPWQPVGVTVGGIRIRPAIEASAGYDDNPERRSGTRKGSALTRIDGDVDAQSDWARHDFRARLKGGYVRYSSTPDASRPDLEGTANLRLDILRTTRAEFETRARVDSQLPGTAELGTRAVGRPQIYSYGGSAGLTQDFNRLSVSLRGSADRTEYQDGQLSNGTKVVYSERNATQYGLRGRVGYEVLPGVRPFVDVLVDQRRFDEAVDLSGFRRNSNGIGARVGSSFEVSRVLTGEVAVGYQKRKFDDSRLPELKGLIGETSLVWQASELTTVNLKGSLALADTTLANVSGAQVSRLEAQVVHALRRNLSVTGFAGFSQTAYDGISLKEDLLSVGARIDYKLTRSMAVRASFTHERFKSSTPGSDYTANVALVGLRFAL